MYFTSRASKQSTLISQQVSPFRHSRTGTQSKGRVYTTGVQQLCTGQVCPGQSAVLLITLLSFPQCLTMYLARVPVTSSLPLLHPKAHPLCPKMSLAPYCPLRSQRHPSGSYHESPQVCQVLSLHRRNIFSATPLVNLLQIPPHCARW